MLDFVGTENKQKIQNAAKKLLREAAIEVTSGSESPRPNTLHFVDSIGWKSFEDTVLRAESEDGKIKVRVWIPKSMIRKELSRSAN